MIPWSLARRDLIAAFTTPLAWLVLAAWSLLVNAVFVAGLHAVHGTAGSSEPLFVSALGWGVVFLMLLAPAVTMSSFAAERAQGTMQLLLTLPIAGHQLVLGKFIAAFLILAALVAATAVQPATLLLISSIDARQLLAGYVGLLLVCALFAALGVWIGLIVETPVASYLITFAAIAVLVLVGLAGEDAWFAPVGRAVGLMPRAWPFFAGEVRLGNAAYFLAGAAGCLVLANATLNARRAA